MTGPLVGSTVKAADTPPSVHDDEIINQSVSSTVSQGSPICGVSFVAPTSGRVWVIWGGRLQGDVDGARILLSVHVRTGGTIGAGTTVSAESNQDPITNPGKGATGAANRIGRATYRVVPGLTPGSTYNVVTEHWAATGSGTVFRRTVTVVPLP